MSEKHLQAREALERGEPHTFKSFGNSMTPLLKNGCHLTFEATDDYQVGDVVFCKVRGRLIDAHLVTKVAADGRFMISNNHGHDNGWTRNIYGRVVAVDGKPFGRPVKGGKADETK